MQKLKIAFVRLKISSSPFPCVGKTSKTKSSLLRSICGADVYTEGSLTAAENKPETLSVLFMEIQAGQTHLR